MPRLHWTVVCAHLDANSTIENPYTAAFKCKLDHFSGTCQNCEKCHGLIRCPFYPTEVAIEVRRSARHPRGGFLVTTKWQVLGFGFSAMEACWKSHLEAAEAPWPYAPESPPGSIRDDFEAQAKAKHDSPLSVVKARKLLD